MNYGFFRIVLLCSAAAVSGCSTLPRSGPDHDLIVSQAAAKRVEEPGAAQAATIQYAFLDLSQDVLSYVDNNPVASLYQSFGGGRGGAPEIFVGVGDALRVTIFESQAGGLFIPSEAGSRPGNFVDLPVQTVDRSGFLTVPYAGSIRAAGRSLPQIQSEIEAKLANRAIEPQAVVSFVTRTASAASVVGEVNDPNKLDITQNGDRVLDLISRAGGFKYPAYESYVTLQRGNRKAKIYANALIDNPSENIYVAPGDVIIVEREQRGYLALGASGLSGEFKFDQEQISLSEGVGKAGGLLDSRADPGQVFVYRYESRSMLENLGMDMTAFPVNVTDIPVIYRTNFRDPSGYFLAQKFNLRDGDILYVSNADSVELIKFLTVLNSVTSTASGVTGDARLVRNNIVSLGKGTSVNIDE